MCQKHCTDIVQCIQFVYSSIHLYVVLALLLLSVEGGTRR